MFRRHVGWLARKLLVKHVFFWMVSILFLACYKLSLPINEMFLDMNRHARLNNSKYLNKKRSHDFSCMDDYVEINSRCTYEPKTCHIQQTLDYPMCSQHISWLKENWKSDDFYQKNGVTGSHCSIVSFLSEIGNDCPLIKGRMKRLPTHVKQYNIPAINNLVTNVLHDNHTHDWMRGRIQSMWSGWISAYHVLQNQNVIKYKRKKKVIVFIGILVNKQWDWAMQIKLGGPLGEVVQWSDLVTVLYLLGHDIFVPSDIIQLDASDVSLEKKLKKNISLVNAHLIYVDAHGLAMLKKRFDYNTFKCKLRIVDSFGTEARFNNAENAEDFKEVLTGMPANTNNLENNIYANFKVHLNQIMTMFPHSPDNSFLGFVAGKKKNLSNDVIKKKNIALVYGKRNNQWQGLIPVLTLINKYIPVHATVVADEGVVIRKAASQGLHNVPPYVVNHGLMKWNKLQEFLKTRVKIFIGLGYPFEGPAPLEAVANGAVFLNPMWDPPLGRHNDHVFGKKRFFSGKPTFRKFSSQHSYMEEFVKSPNSFNVNYDNKTEVKLVIRKILAYFDKNEVNSYLPFEFSHQGMLQRLDSYTRRQDFCTSSDSWVPKEELNVVLSNTDESCKDACRRKGMACENTFFQYVNERKVFYDRKLPCSRFLRKKSLQAPYHHIKTNICVLQKYYLFYSCVDSSSSYRRLCPCRNFIKEQVALCPSCL